MTSARHAFGDGSKLEISREKFENQGLNQVTNSCNLNS
jgi:hypothetical protein